MNFLYVQCDACDKSQVSRSVGRSACSREERTGPKPTIWPIRPKVVAVRIWMRCWKHCYCKRNEEQMTKRTWQSRWRSTSLLGDGADAEIKDSGSGTRWIQVLEKLETNRVSKTEALCHFWERSSWASNHGLCVCFHLRYASTCCGRSVRQRVDDTVVTHRKVLLIVVSECRVCPGASASGAAAVARGPATPVVRERLALRGLSAAASTGRPSLPAAR